jgi:hypothetical protein
MVAPVRITGKQRTPFWRIMNQMSSMIMVFGGDEGVIERARAIWNGVFVPRRIAPL